MSIFGGGKTCVFSEVNARLTQDGQPLPGVEVIRRWEWQKMKEDRTKTNEKGEFSFPAEFEKSLPRLFPSELVIAQGLYVVIDGEEQQIWSNSKREPEENAEFGGKIFDVHCELNNEMKVYRDYGSIMHTLCTWEK